MQKKTLSSLGLIGVVIAAVIGGTIAREFSKEVSRSALSPTTLSPQKTEEILIAGFTIAADKINKQGPTMIDKDTRMDRASVGPGSRLTYFYSLPNYSSKDVDPSGFHVNVEPALKRKVCANIEIKPSLQYGATYVYVYSGNNGMEIARFEIRKNDCN